MKRIARRGDDVARALVRTFAYVEAVRRQERRRATRECVPPLGLNPL